MMPVVILVSSIYSRQLITSFIGHEYLRQYRYIVGSVNYTSYSKQDLNNWYPKTIWIVPTIANATNTMGKKPHRLCN